MHPFERHLTKPIVSFVIPVFNAEREITYCLHSIRNLQASAELYEVLIIDNGSTDRTQQIISELGFDFQVISGVHVSALRNRGARIAQGDYLAFVDADVELTPQWLHRGLMAFTEPHVVAAGCFPHIPTEATWVQRAWDIHQRGRRLTQEMTPVAWLPSMNLIVRRETFRAVAGFNEHLETAEDVDLCYRLGQHGTILDNPAMEAVHWGEAPDLPTFWRKEVWRGMGNLQGVLSHGLRWDEIPSLGYPLYVLCCVGLLVVSIGVDVHQSHLQFLPLSFLLFLLPPLLLALKTAFTAERPASIPKLLLLYGLYGFARAFAVVKTWTASRA